MLPYTAKKKGRDFAEGIIKDFEMGRVSPYIFRVNPKCSKMYSCQMGAEGEETTMEEKAM